jgi:hypothetical protein
MPQPASVGCNVQLHSDFEQIVYCGAASLSLSQLPLDFVAVLDSARGNLVFRGGCTTSSIRVEKLWEGLLFICAPERFTL